MISDNNFPVGSRSHGVVSSLDSLRTYQNGGEVDSDVLVRELRVLTDATAASIGTNNREALGVLEEQAGSATPFPGTVYASVIQATCELGAFANSNSQGTDRLPKAPDAGPMAVRAVLGRFSDNPEAGFGEITEVVIGAIRGCDQTGLQTLVSECEGWRRAPRTSPDDAQRHGQLLSVIGVASWAAHALNGPELSPGRRGMLNQIVADETFVVRIEQDGRYVPVEGDEATKTEAEAKPPISSVALQHFVDADYLIPRPLGNGLFGLVPTRQARPYN